MATLSHNVIEARIASGLGRATQYNEVAELISYDAYKDVQRHIHDFIYPYIDRVNNHEIAALFDNALINHFGE